MQVRYVYVTPDTYTAGGALRICHTRHSHSRRCVTYVSYPSLTQQAVRYAYVTPVTHEIVVTMQELQKLDISQAKSLLEPLLATKEGARDLMTRTVGSLK
jgi:hypothetical protein